MVPVRVRSQSTREVMRNPDNAKNMERARKPPFIHPKPAW